MSCTCILWRHYMGLCRPHYCSGRTWAVIWLNKDSFWTRMTIAWQTRYQQGTMHHSLACGWPQALSHQTGGARGSFWHAKQVIWEDYTTHHYVGWHPWLPGDDAGLQCSRGGNHPNGWLCEGSSWWGTWRHERYGHDASCRSLVHCPMWEVVHMIEK